MPWKWAVSWTLFSLLLGVRCLTEISSDTDLLLCGSPSETVTAVCKSDFIHRNLGTFSQASPLFKAEFNAHFPVLVAVKVQPVSWDRAVRAGNGIRGFKPHPQPGLERLLGLYFKFSLKQNTQIVYLIQRPTPAVGLTQWQWVEIKMDFPAECSLSSCRWGAASAVVLILGRIAKAEWTLCWGLAQSSQILSSDTRAGFIFCSLPAH